jgi:cytochrome P450
MTTYASATTDRAYDPADVSSKRFWSQTARERDATFAELRADRPLTWHPPVEVSLLPDANDPGFWAVVRHDDVVRVSRDSETFVSGDGVMFENVPADLLEASQSFLAMDDPRHAKIRKLVSAAFTPRQIKRIEDTIRARARSIVDDLVGQQATEFVHGCAALLPMQTVCDMIGIAESDQQSVVTATEYMTGWNDPDVVGDRDPLVAVAESQMYLHALALDLTTRRRAEPADDLISALVAAEIDGEQLSDFEIAAFVVLLSVAGNDTTRQTTSHAIQALTDFPEQRAWLLADLDGRLDTAVEELVRWATPVMTFRRTASHDVELDGSQIRAGEKVVLFYSSANRDESTFGRPWQLDLSRQPNPHVGFGGGGAHFCLGAGIARTQLRSILGELLRRLPDITAEETRYLTGNFVHGIKSMRVRLAR